MRIADMGLPCAVRQLTYVHTKTKSTTAKILIAKRSINLDEVPQPRPNGVGVLLLELLARANFPPSTRLACNSPRAVRYAHFTARGSSETKLFTSNRWPPIPAVRFVPIANRFAALPGELGSDALS